MVNGYASGARNVVSVGGPPGCLGQMQPVKNLFQKRRRLRSHLLEELGGESPGTGSPAAVQKLFDACWNPVFAPTTAAVAPQPSSMEATGHRVPGSQLRR